MERGTGDAGVKRVCRRHLRVADQLSVQLCIKGRHVATVNVQHGVPHDADLENKYTINIIPLLTTKPYNI